MMTRFRSRPLIAAAALLGLTMAGCTHEPTTVGAANPTPTAEADDINELVVVDHGSPSEILDFAGVLVGPGATSALSTVDVAAVLCPAGSTDRCMRQGDKGEGIVGSVDMYTGLVSDMNVRRVDPSEGPPLPPDRIAGPHEEIPMPRDLPAVLLVFQRFETPISSGPPPRPSSAIPRPPPPQLVDVILALDATTGQLLFMRTGSLLGG